MDPHDLVGRVLIGKLRVIRALGAGGMGSVYEVEHTLTHNRHALKVLHPRLAMDPNAARRLVVEAGVAGKVRSPRIVSTLDVGQLEDGRPYILMELLEGRSWRTYLQERGAVDPQHAVRLALQVCEGLAAAHAAGILHRDLKPDNVFLVGPPGHEEVKLVDFGLGKELGAAREQAITEAGALMGTAEYLSPEQAAGRADLDGRTDQFALGVMLYETLTGRRPFSGASFADVLARVASGAHVRLHEAAPHLPRELADVVERAMSTEAERRFADVRALAAALRPFAPSPMSSAPPSVGGGAPPARAVATPMAFAPTVAPSVAPSVAHTRRGPSRALLLTSVLAAGLLVGCVAGVAGWLLTREGAPSVSDLASQPAPAPTSDSGAPVAPALLTSDAGPMTPHIYSSSDDPAEAALLVVLDEHFRQRRYQRCLEQSEQTRATVPVLERRAACALAPGCVGAFVRACGRIHELDPQSYFYETQCTPSLRILPDTERGQWCTYRGR